MLMYILYIEPLLIYIERRVTGCIIGNLKTDEAYCDDLNVMTNDVDDLLEVDEAVTKFESISGAILSRNRKCSIIGFGSWKDRVVWPLHYVKAVKKIKVFGIIVTNSLKHMIKKNWEVRYEKFENILMSWKGRRLDTIFQRVEVIKTYAMSRLYYVASILPLPEAVATRIEKMVGKFI